MKKVIVEIGSSVVRVHKYEDDQSELVLEKEFQFKKNYSPNRGLNFNDEEGLIRLLERVNANYFNYSVEAFATGIFRELSDDQLKELQSESRKRAKIEILIISPEEENYFKKLLLRYSSFGKRADAEEFFLADGIMAAMMAEESN
ncbi:MAG: hypothetical protein NTW50_02200 [Candidatus Berkelbacteria bacterium]|nr:hypothetical protein [Candidatus Berkelbacteria bacterium]